MTDPFTINRLSFNHETVFYAFFLCYETGHLLIAWMLLSSRFALPHIHTKLLSNDSFISLGFAAARVEGFFYTPKRIEKFAYAKKALMPKQKCIV